MSIFYLCKLCSISYSRSKHPVLPHNFKLLRRYSKLDGFSTMIVEDPVRKVVILVFQGTAVIEKGVYESASTLQKFRMVLRLAGDIRNDIEIVNRRIPSQFLDDVVPMISKFLTRLKRKYKDYTFITTGHSLGAILADLSCIYLLNLGKECISHTFESPGSAPMIKSYLNKDRRLFNKYRRNFHIYNSALPNLVNTANEQYGRILPLYPLRKNKKGLIPKPLTISLYVYNIFSPKSTKSLLTKSVNTICFHSIDFLMGDKLLKQLYY